MFTGLVEEVATVSRAESTDRGLRIDVFARQVMDDLKIGDSIAVNGACQTIVALTPFSFCVEAMSPTLSRTTLGHLRSGSRVNLERPLPVGARLGGHIVQGHVDGVGSVLNVVREGEFMKLDVEIPADVAEVTVLHGSITIDGVSLTVNEIPSEGVVQVALIPHTLENTNLSDRRIGDRVNLEGDMIGRFVVEYMKRRGADAV